MSQFLVLLLAMFLFPLLPSSLAAELGPTSCQLVAGSGMRPNPEIATGWQLVGHSSNVQGEGSTLTVMRGRAVCLDAAGHQIASLFDCPGSRFGFASKESRLYRFLPGDTMMPVFTDTRVRQRELQITARLRGGDQLEIIKLLSVKEGKLYDIFYYCDVCSITAYTPGLCPCCRDELEFRETPQ